MMLELCISEPESDRDHIFVNIVPGTENEMKKLAAI